MVIGRRCPLSVFAWYLNSLAPRNAPQVYDAGEGTMVPKKWARLNMCDLAGSERQKQTHAAGVRLVRCPALNNTARRRNVLSVPGKPSGCVWSTASSHRVPGRHPRRSRTQNYQIIELSSPINLFSHLRWNPRTSTKACSRFSG